MSGTSFDGIDASIVYTNGYKIKRTIFNKTFPYSKKTRLLIIKALNSPKSFCTNKIQFQTLSFLITLEHSKAVNKLIRDSKIKPFLIGFHGQTILHNPKDKISIQLGDGELLSKLVKTKVIYNFRLNDIKNGGEGAPIAPIYHQQIIKNKCLTLPSTIINIGGICNITYWDGKNLLGFDVGPGNNLMDQYMAKTFNKKYDNFGKKASKGIINYTLINNFLNNQFYKKSPPKSLERYELTSNHSLKKIYNLDKFDCMATLCALTSFGIKESFRFFPKKPETTVIVGGGQKNKFLVSLIKKLNVSNLILTGDEIDLPSDFIESELIAFLAIRKIKKLPSTFTSTTGVKTETVLGEITTYKI